MKPNFYRRNRLVLMLIPVILILLLIFVQKFDFKSNVKSLWITLLDKQKIIIEVPPEIDKNDIFILWNGTGYNDTKIYNNENNWGRIPLRSDNHSFSVFYKNKLIKTVGHFRITDNSLHNYNFKFYKKNNEINFTFNVLGPDSVTCNEWDHLYYWTKSLTISEFKDSPLKLKENRSEIENTLNFKVQPDDLKRLITPDIDTTLKKVECLINGENYAVSKLKNKGKSALKFTRKSYNVTLKDSAKFIDNKGIERKLKTFSLISLSMDQYYFRNRIAHELLNELKLSNMFLTYVEVKMNMETQGVYLLIENPKKYLVESLNASFMIRRNYEHYIYKDLENKYDIDYEAEKFLTSTEKDNFIAQYKSVYNLIKEKNGTELYESLEEVMDIEEYMRIMAFNYIICNHDYTDEQFFYIDTLNASNRFNIMPWDFDDIFSNTPHEGWVKRNERIKDKLIFSCEDKLDLVIATDSVLYSKYLIELNQVANVLNSSILSRIYQNTYRELYPFYVNEEIMSKSVLDESSMQYDLFGLKEQLVGTYEFLTDRINSIHSYLNVN